MFQIELKDPAEAEANISNNITCLQTGIISKVEEFCAPISVRQCYNCQNFRHSAKNCKAKIKFVICGEGHSHKGFPNREKKQPRCANCKGLHVAECSFRQRVVDNQKNYTSILKHNSAPPPQLHNPRVTHLFYSQSVNKICIHCGHPNRSATSVLLKCPKRHS